MEMQIENEPTIKIKKVGRLIKVSVILEIFYDGIFDDLMDKYEQHRDLFEYMYLRIETFVNNCLELDKITKEYQKLLKLKNIFEIHECNF
jgi:hypothetical protein